MDLALYGRVLWRFKAVVALGLVLAVGLSILATAKITSHGLQYRKPVVWQSSTSLLLTQRGFPEGRALFPPAVPDKQYPYADTGRFASLTELYAQFANSDEVKAIMRKNGASQKETISAAPVLPTSPTALLPVIALYGQGGSAAQAVDATQRGRAAFLEFVHAQQASASIPDNARVDIRVLESVTPAVVIQPRKKTLPIVVFIAVLSAAIGLAFVLENLRPRIHQVPQAETDEPPAAGSARRTA